MVLGLWQPFVVLLLSWPALRGITLSFTYSPAKGANHLHFVPEDHALNEPATILEAPFWKRRLSGSFSCLRLVQNQTRLPKPLYSM